MRLRGSRLIFKEHILQAQEWSTLISRKPSRGGRRPGWTRSFWQNRKQKNTRDGNRFRRPRRTVKMISEHAGVGLEKPKPTWKWVWRGTIKATRNASTNTTESKLGKNVGLLPHVAQNVVTENMERTEVPNSFLSELVRFDGKQSHFDSLTLFLCEFVFVWFFFLENFFHFSLIFLSNLKYSAVRK